MMNYKLLLTLVLAVGLIASFSLLIGDGVLYGQDSSLAESGVQPDGIAVTRDGEHDLQKSANPTTASSDDTISYTITLSPSKAISGYLLVDSIPTDLQLIAESVRVELQDGGDIEPPSIYCDDGIWPNCEPDSVVQIVVDDSDGGGPLNTTLTLRYGAVIRHQLEVETILNTVTLFIAEREVVSDTAEVTISSRETPTPEPTIPTPTPTDRAPRAYMPLVQRNPIVTPTPPPDFPKIENGDFEGDRTAGSVPGWEEGGVNENLVVCKSDNILPAALNPRSPECVAWLGGFDGVTTYISQTVSIDPYYEGEVSLGFYFALGSNETCGSSGDTASVYVNGERVEDLAIPELCRDNQTAEWSPSIVDLGDVSGDVAIKFEVAQNESLNSNWFLDDVSLCSDDANLAGSVPSCN